MTIENSFSPDRHRPSSVPGVSTYRAVQICAATSKYIVNIQQGTSVTIGDSGIAPAELMRAVRTALESVRASEDDAALMQYLAAVRAIRVFGEALDSTQEGHDRFVVLRAHSHVGSTGEEESTPVRELLAQRHPHVSGPSLWLFGNPGFGKTTLLRHLARAAWFEPTTIGLDRPHLPLYARLSCVDQARCAFVGRTLSGALDLAGDVISGAKIAEDFLETWSRCMNGAPWLLLLDGMDEVPATAHEAVFEWIGRVLDLGFRIVVSSRPQPKPPDSLKRRFKIYSLDSLSEGEQKELAHALLGERGPELLAELDEFGRESLRNSPMLLTLAAIVFDAEGSLPSRRVDLYARACDRFLHRARQRAVGSDVLAECSPFALETLQALALAMQLDHTKCSIKDLRPAVAEELAARTGRPRAFFESPAIGDTFIRALGRHSGIFEVLGQNCGWLHPTFREYLAAVRLSRYEPGHEQVAPLLERAADASWRQVLLMLLTLWSDEHDIDEAFVTLAQSDADGAMMAAQALFEGAQVSNEAEQKGMSALCQATLSDAKRSICVALLTRGYDDTKERLRLAKDLGGRAWLAGTFQGLVARLRHECEELHQKNAGNRMGYIPQWFEFLQKLGEAETLEELAADTSLPVLTRAIALNHRAKLAPRVELSKFGDLFDAVSKTPEATAIVVHLLVELGELSLGENVLGASNCGWEEAKSSVDSLLKASPQALSIERLRNEFHPRVALALVHGQMQSGKGVAAEQWDALFGALDRFNSMEPKPDAAPGTVEDEFIARLTSSDNVRSDLQRVRALLQYSAHENAFVDVAQALGANTSLRELAEWVDGSELPELALILIAESLCARTESADCPAILALLGRIHGFGDPDSAMAPLCAYIRGGIHYRLGAIEPARTQFKLAAAKRSLSVPVDGALVNLNVGNVAARLLAEICASHDKSLKDALQILDEYLAAGPADAATFVVRGNVRFELGEFQMAVEDYTIALNSMHHMDDASKARFADALRMTGDYSTARQLAAQVAKDGSEYRARQVMGACAVVLETPAALVDLNRALEIDPNGEFALMQRAYANRLLGNWEAAVADARMVVASNAEDFDAAVLVRELSIYSGTNGDDTAILIEDREDLNVFVDILRRRTWSETELQKLQAAVQKAYDDALQDPAQLTLEAVSHLIVYATLCSELGDPLALLAHLLERGRLDRAMWTVLPLCGLLRKVCPAAQSRASDVCLKILEAVNTAGGDMSWLDSGGLQLRLYPDPKTYPFPMYCSNENIGGLEQQKMICSEILKKKTARHTPAMLLVRLDTDSRLYGQCNFKQEPEMPFDLKFCDEVNTTIHKNLATFVFHHGVGQLLFLDPELKGEFDAALRSRSWPVRTMLVSA